MKVLASLIGVSGPCASPRQHVCRTRGQASGPADTQCDSAFLAGCRKNHPMTRWPPPLNRSVPESLLFCGHPGMSRKDVRQVTDEPAADVETEATNGRPCTPRAHNATRLGASSSVVRTTKDMNAARSHNLSSLRNLSDGAARRRRLRRPLRRGHHDDLRHRRAHRASSWQSHRRLLTHRLATPAA